VVLVFYRNDLVKCLGQAEKLAENILRIQSLEWPLLMSQQTLTELATVMVLKQQLEEKKNKVKYNKLLTQGRRKKS